MGGCASKPKVKEGDVTSKLLVPVPEKKADFAAKNTVVEKHLVPEKRDHFAAKNIVVEKNLVLEKRDDFAAKNTVVEKKMLPEKRDDFAVKSTEVEKKLVVEDGKDNPTKCCYPSNSFTQMSMREELRAPSKCEPQEPKSREEHTQPLVDSIDSCGKMAPDSSPKSKEKPIAQEIKTLILQTTLKLEENVAKEALLDLPKIENYSSESNNKTEEKQAENTLKPEILHDKSIKQKAIEESTPKIETSNDELEEKHNKSLMENVILDKDVKNPLKLEGFLDEKTEHISHDENTLRQESLIENTTMEKPIEEASKPDKEIEENHAEEDTVKPEKNIEEESVKNTHKSDGSEEENILETKMSREEKPIQNNNKSSDVIKMEEDHEENFTKLETQPRKRVEENMKPQQPEIPREKETETMLLDRILMKEMEEKWLGR
ncbi:unnamed protein product [Cuscuta campestris]|uniref:Uncharacterized protein n=1 Tax=Cuscuta campestris TaxID=132261 RepID=A0A484N894_9ASTE|nr:unnamed protein product [Cuscuta campestris]